MGRGFGPIGPHASALTHMAPPPDYLFFTIGLVWVIQKRDSIPSRGIQCWHMTHAPWLKQ